MMSNDITCLTDFLNKTCPFNIPVEETVEETIKLITEQKAELEDALWEVEMLRNELKQAYNEFRIAAYKINKIRDRTKRFKNKHDKHEKRTK